MRGIYENCLSLLSVCAFSHSLTSKRALAHNVQLTP
jgi:hypothetical protein